MKPYRLVACAASLAILSAAGAVSAATTFTGTSSATFGTPTAGFGSVYSGVGTNDFTMGVPVDDTALNNRYLIDGVSFSTDADTTFAVAGLTYRNGRTRTGTDVTSVPVDLLLAFTSPGGIGNQAFNFNFQFNITPNSVDPITDTANDDLLTVQNVQSSTVFTYLGNTYTLRLLGFGSNANQLTSTFRLPEDQTTQSTLWATISAPIEPPPTNAVPLPPAAWAGLGMLALFGAQKSFRRLRKHA